MTPVYPEGLTPLEATLYEYVTNPDTVLPNPTSFIDEETVFHTASHGPRTPDEATHILNTPHLLELLTGLWDETPPTIELTTRLQTTSEGQDLLARTSGAANTKKPSNFMKTPSAWMHLNRNSSFA